MQPDRQWPTTENRGVPNSSSGGGDQTQRHGALNRGVPTLGTGAARCRVRQRSELAERQRRLVVSVPGPART